MNNGHLAHTMGEVIFMRIKTVLSVCFGGLWMAAVCLIPFLGHEGQGTTSSTPSATPTVSDWHQTVLVGVLWDEPKFCLLSLDAASASVTVTPLGFDLWDEEGRNGKTAYQYGGASYLCERILAVKGVECNHFVIFTKNSFEKYVDLVGGILVKSVKSEYNTNGCESSARRLFSSELEEGFRAAGDEAIFLGLFASFTAQNDAAMLRNAEALRDLADTDLDRAAASRFCTKISLFRKELIS